MKEHFGLKVAISATAAIAIGARLIWPDLKVDATTLGLLIVAIAPWLIVLVESAKFPGGWEVKFRNVQNAGDKVIQEAPPTGAKAERAAQPSYLEIAPLDPNIALVALRLEVEKRVRAIAEAAGIQSRGSLLRLFQDLRQRGVLRDAALSGVQELVAAGNSAAHGATVEPAVASWAFDYGPQVLSALDATLLELGNQPALNPAVSD